MYAHGQAVLPAANLLTSQQAAKFAQSHLQNLCAGCVLVTFKSRLSVPPYRIENKTTDVVVYFAQSSLTGAREKWNWLTPQPGGSAMAYAWDEPTAHHRLQVQVDFIMKCFILDRSIMGKDISRLSLKSQQS